MQPALCCFFSDAVSVKEQHLSLFYLFRLFSETSSPFLHVGLSIIDSKAFLSAFTACQGYSGIMGEDMDLIASAEERGRGIEIGRGHAGRE